MSKTNTKIFNSKKNLFILAAIIAGVLIIGAGTAFALSASTTKTYIGVEKAKSIALEDAQVEEQDAEFTKSKLDQDDNHYDIEFLTDTALYDYEIEATSGKILEKSEEDISGDTDTTTNSGYIGVEAAKEYALKHADLTENDVTFTKAVIDSDDGVMIYDIEFYTDDAEYDYEINALSGKVVSYDKENFVTNKNSKKNGSANNDTSNDSGSTNSGSSSGSGSNSGNDTTTNSGNSGSGNSGNNNSSNGSSGSNKNNSSAGTNTGSYYIGMAKAKSIALNNAGVSSANATFTKTKLDYDDGIRVYDIEFYTSDAEYEYEINATTGSIVSKDVEKFKKSSTSATTSSSLIGVDKAKTIALNHAGLSANSVTFEKAKLDYEDGQKVYEIEFYANGIEYEYVIDAASGQILEYDADRDD